MIPHPRTLVTTLVTALLVGALPVLAGGSDAPPMPREPTVPDPAAPVVTAVAGTVLPGGTIGPATMAGPVTSRDHRLSPEGFRVARGHGPVVGTYGQVRSYTVEVEPLADGDLTALLATVRRTLEDPDRGWTSHGEVRLQWVDDLAVADLRVVLAHPDTVDRHCAEVDLETHGRYSCWDGQRVLLNGWRWAHGAADFDDLSRYRTYLVNHEVGHALGRRHTSCPSPGEAAPVMMQQSVTTGACEPNGWPWP